MKLKKSVIALFLGPAVIVYLAIFLYPTLRAALMSLYEISSMSDAMDKWSFVGLSNYSELFTNSYFLKSVGNVFKIWLIGGVIVFVAAFFFAVLISGVRGKAFWRAVIYLPNTISVVVMSVVWLHYVYNPTFGLLTTVFKWLGLESWAAFQWTADNHIFVSMLIAFCFGSIGYFMLILGAAMDGIPTDFYEAAKLEGSSVVHSFFKITLPLIRDVFQTTLVLWTTIAINFFVWSAVFGWQIAETMTPGYYMYLKVFGSNQSSSEVYNVGLGASIGVLITIAVLIISWIISKLLGSKDRLEY